MSGWVGQWVNGVWVGQWVGSLQITKNQINFELMEIIQFCLKVYDLLRHHHLWVGVWVVGWVYGWLGGSVGQWVGSGQITKNLINFDLIKIIQFYLKIYDL